MPKRIQKQNTRSFNPTFTGNQLTFTGQQFSNKPFNVIKIQKNDQSNMLRKMLKKMLQNQSRKKKKKKKRSATMASPQMALKSMIDRKNEAESIIVYVFYELCQHHGLPYIKASKLLQKYDKLKENQTSGQLFKSHAITLLHDNDVTLSGADLWRIYGVLTTDGAPLPTLKRGASILESFQAMVGADEDDDDCDDFDDVPFTMTSTYTEKKKLTPEVLEFLN